MRKRARRCPLCSAWMTDKPNLPKSKHLDHIVPLNQGGTHTHGNVRIICASCNLKRPKDGRDYAGPVTLWAQGEIPVARPDRRSGVTRTTCRNGLHPWVPENIEVTSSQKRCKPCSRASKRRVETKRRPRRQCKCGAMFPAPGGTLMCPACVDQAANKAAELHASGMTWDQVAAEVGYGSGWGAAFAARRIGYTPAPRLPAPKPEPLLCSCGLPAWRTGCCRGCLAWRAVELYNAGRTLAEIGGELGLRSKSGVTNLIKTVAAIDTRIGRPDPDRVAVPMA